MTFADRVGALRPTAVNRVLQEARLMKRQWKEIPRGDKRAQWAGMYVTLNSKGSIV